MSVTKSQHSIRISEKSLATLQRWSREQNGYSGMENSFLGMLTLAQKLTCTLRRSDSLEIVDTHRTLGEFLSDTGKDRVVGEKFLSFLYRDANGLASQRATLDDEDPQRPFNHADVFPVPSHQFEFLVIARQKAVVFGADPKLTIHDVGAAIIEQLQNVSRDGCRYELGGKEFKIRKATAPAV